MKDQRSRTLERQVRKHVPPELIPVLQAFLESVERSYGHYEQDRRLLMRAMEISSEELNAANARLQDNNEFLAGLHYGVSHDLKNQAINVNGMISMLRRDIGADRDRLLTTLTFLEKAGAQFERTVRDVLLVSHTEMHPHRSDLVPAGALRQMAEVDLGFRITGARAQLHWAIDDEAQLWPQEPFRTALSNLLSNGIKYHHPGRTPELWVTMRATACARDLCVRDNGRGIDLDRDGEKLFRMFERLSSGRDQEGSGVGLFVLKKLIKRAGGTITLDSTPDTGTTVHISIPR